ncbi:MAG: DUF3054 domain-containing protein [Actinomycetes bacterium]
MVADGVCVAVFALAGRRSHAASGELAGVLLTAWPFLAGAGVGWLLARGWRGPASLRTGVVVWLTTVALGTLLRLVSGRTAQWPFVVVATLTLGVLLVGWRALLRRLPSGRRPPAARLP